MSSIIVSDSSPLNVLIQVGQVDVLSALFEKVLVPPKVLIELRHPQAPQAVQLFAQTTPAWLVEQAPQIELPLIRLDPGERSAISLALELNTLLLIDERDGRKEAMARGIRVIGAIGILERAADEGLIKDLGTVYQMIRGSNFRVSDKLLDDSLKRHQSK